MKPKLYINAPIREAMESKCKNCTKILWYISECEENGAHIIRARNRYGPAIIDCTGFEDYRKYKQD